MNIYKYLYTCICICIYIYIYKYADVCIYVCMEIHTHIYAHRTFVTVLYSCGSEEDGYVGICVVVCSGKKLSLAEQNKFVLMRNTQKTGKYCQKEQLL